MGYCLGWSHRLKTFLQFCPGATLLFEGFCWPRSFTILFRSLNTTRLGLRVVFNSIAFFCWYLLEMCLGGSWLSPKIWEGGGAQMCHEHKFSHLPFAPGCRFWIWEMTRTQEDRFAVCPFLGLRHGWLGLLKSASLVMHSLGLWKAAGTMPSSDYGMVQWMTLRLSRRTMSAVFRFSVSRAPKQNYITTSVRVWTCTVFRIWED